MHQHFETRIISLSDQEEEKEVGKGKLSPGWALMWGLLQAPSSPLLQESETAGAGLCSSTIWHLNGTLL